MKPNRIKSLNSTIIAVVSPKMASRMTWVCSGIMFMVLGAVGKFGAVLACVPEPVIGGLNLVALGMLVSMGLASLRYVNMDSGRNMIILGTAIMMGMVIPFWLIDNPGAIQTGGSARGIYYKIIKMYRFRC